MSNQILELKHLWTDISLLSKLAVSLAIAYDPTSPSVENIQFRWMTNIIVKNKVKKLLYWEANIIKKNEVKIKQDKIL